MSDASSYVPVHSGFWRRAAATLVDACLLLVLLLAVSHAVGWPGLLLREEFAPRLGAFLASLIYYAGFESSVWQATPGKRAVRIKVTDLAGHRISIARAVWRHLAELLSVALLLVGFLMAAFTRRRQCLHDMMAGTLVVRAARTPQEIAFAPPAAAWPRWRIVLLLGAYLGAVALVPRLAPWVRLPFDMPGIDDGRYHARTEVAAALYYATDAISTAEGLYEETRDFSKVDVADVDLDDEAQRTISQLTITEGTIRITFGGESDAALQGRRLTLTPALDGAGNISWVCGYAEVPDGYTITRLDYRRLTNVLPDALPGDCVADDGDTADKADKADGQDASSIRI